MKGGGGKKRGEAKRKNQTSKKKINKNSSRKKWGGTKGDGDSEKQLEKRERRKGVQKLGEKGVCGGSRMRNVGLTAQKMRKNDASGE